MTCDKVLEIFSGLKTSKSLVLNGLVNPIVKEVLNCCPNQIPKLLNFSLKEEQFLTKWQ